MFDIAKKTFSLSESFIEKYKGRQPEFGPLGYFTFKRTYARSLAEDGTEEFWQTVQRIVEGTFSIQKNYCKANRLPWDERKAQRSAKRMFELMWDFKWLPPGRGLWSMGTEAVAEKGSAALNNCAFVSTVNIAEEFSKPFRFVMDMSMLGVGCGFDTKGAGSIMIPDQSIKEGGLTIVIPDTREGWVEALGSLIDAWFKGTPIPSFDYSKIRPAGEPIRTFGGTASGPEPLRAALDDISDLLRELQGKEVTSATIVDIMNIIGRCVVAGNVRRCLPLDTRVITPYGFKEIKQIKVGDLVSTNDGYQKVTNIFKQGEQRLIKVNHQDGFLRCTPNHRVAVLTGFNEISWKEAGDLLPGDRLAFKRNTDDSKIQSSLPEFVFEKSPMANSCKDIVIPSLDEEIAWLLGVIAGDGYVAIHDIANGKRNGRVAIACHSDDIDHILKVKKALERFGVSVFVKQKKGENCKVVESYSVQLATYFGEWLKQPNKTLRIPDCIKSSSIEIRKAYICGILDADGSVINRPLNVCSTVYLEFAKDVQSLLYSCGIESRLVTGEETPSRAGWQPLHKVCLISQYAQSQLSEAAVSKKIELKSRSQNSNGFPSKWVDHYVKGWDKNSKQINTDTYERLLGDVSFVPIEVLSIEKDVTEETIDIEVENNHCFIAEGVLVHNSAEIALGDPDDKEFVLLKQDQEKLISHRWCSNNSIFAKVGMDYSWHAEQTSVNGEPGYFWLENARAFGRMKDPADWADNECVGVNPCSEQTLHNYELCTLVETFPARHDSLEEYLETLKVAYLYAKTVTLVPTHWPETNAVMTRNRRIGLSQSGIIKAFTKHGRRTMLEWCDKGYEFIKGLDIQYSNWLGIPRSIKRTSVKPSGSVSLLPGEPPGIHYPHSEYYIRRIRVGIHSPLWEAAQKAGYHVEPAVGQESSTMVVEFPVKEEAFAKAKDEVSIWEQVENAKAYQKYWADNSVSITVTFNKEEAKEIKHVLELSEDSLKGISFLPLSDHGYQQAPYETIDKEEYERRIEGLKPMELNEDLAGGAAPKFCDGDTCEI